MRSPLAELLRGLHDAFDAAKDAPPEHFARLRAQGGRQRPGPRTRSIRGWSVPTLEPTAPGGERPADAPPAKPR